MGTATLYGRAAFGTGQPTWAPTRSTPLDDGEAAHIIPKLLLWGMKDHCRTRFGHHGDALTEHRYGTGDSALYILDGGAKLVTIGRVVGSSPDGATYCLIGELDREHASTLDAGGRSPKDVLGFGKNYVLCAVYDGGPGASNIADVQRFSTLNEIPPSYLPPHPFIRFTDTI